MVFRKNRLLGRSQSERYLRAARSLRRLGLRPKSLWLERLEPRVLLAGADPRDLFARDVFPAGGASSDFATADVHRDGAWTSSD